MKLWSPKSNQFIVEKNEKNLVKTEQSFWSWSIRSKLPYNLAKFNDYSKKKLAYFLIF